MVFTFWWQLTPGGPAIIQGCNQSIALPKLQFEHNKFKL